MKTTLRIALLILLSAIIVMNISCKKETTTPAEDWCAECTGQFPNDASSYNFSDQFCGTESQVDYWVKDKKLTGAGRIPNNTKYINCNKHKAK
jgi:hypothetical protein